MPRHCIALLDTALGCCLSKTYLERKASSVAYTCGQGGAPVRGLTRATELCKERGLYYCAGDEDDEGRHCRPLAPRTPRSAAFRRKNTGSRVQRGVPRGSTHAHGPRLAARARRRGPTSPEYFRRAGSGFCVRCAPPPGHRRRQCLWASGSAPEACGARCPGRDPVLCPAGRFGAQRVGGLEQQRRLDRFAPVPWLDGHLAQALLPAGLEPNPLHEADGLRPLHRAVLSGRYRRD